MKPQNCILIYCAIAFAQLGLLSCNDLTSTKISLEQAIERQLNKEQHEYQFSKETFHHTLQRKRRYLEFPEGSSFQLVYDMIIGVVDFTNYLVLGITVALAWELPSKPPSEILNDINERLKDGTLGTSRNDTITKIKYIDNKASTASAKTPVNLYQYKLQPMFRPPMHYQYYMPKAPDKDAGNKKSQIWNYYTPKKYKTWTNKFYTTKQTHPFAKWIDAKTVPQFSVKGIKYPWWNLPERLKNSFNTRPSVRRFDKNMIYGRTSYSNSYKKPSGTYPTFGGTGRAEHRIYPVFGKRSISDNEMQAKNLTISHRVRFKRSGITTAHLTKWDRMHIEQHRRTRRELYERIETYLNGRGSPGHQCVLRALCETGQKSNDHKPGSFVGELMRAIFTLPEPLDTTPADSQQQLNYKELRYDFANTLTDDCGIRYSQCKDSLWSSHFVA